MSSLSQLKTLLSQFGSVYAVGEAFAVLKLQVAGYNFDFSLPRQDQKSGPGHRGFTVTIHPDLSFTEASARRDFTINSMGYDVEQDLLLDPHGGEKDLENSVLRLVGPAFSEDPLRVFRAMQFCARFGLSPTPETVLACRACDLSELPKDRIVMEFKTLLLKAKTPSLGLCLGETLGISTRFPVFKGRCTPADWKAVDAMAALHPKTDDAGLNLLLAAVCDDLFPVQRRPVADPRDYIPSTWQDALSFLDDLTDEKALKARSALFFRFSHYADDLYQNRPSDVDYAIRRLATLVPIQPLALMLAAVQADTAVGDWFRDRATALGVWTVAPTPLLQGKDLLAIGYSAGPALGPLLATCFDAQLRGRFTSKKEALLWIHTEHPLD